MRNDEFMMPAVRLSCALFLLFLAAAPRTMAQVLPAPRLLSPADSSINQPTSLTFAWRAVLGASSYELQISDTPLFTSLVYHDSSIAGQSTDVSGLHRSTTYYWRVRAQNLVDVSSWSDTWIFGTVPVPPPSPVPSSPADGAVVPTSVTLTWGASSGATSYRVQLSASPVFSTLVVDDSTLVTTGRLVQGLQNNFDYYWRVNASNSGGASSWSASRSFTTATAPPAAPNLASPPNGAADQPPTVSLSWSSTPGASSYHLQVSAGSGFATLALDDSALTATSRSVGPLANGTIYYWRVSAKNAGGQGAWSNAWYFATVPAAPPAPTLLSPPNSAANQPVTVTVSWNAASGASRYRLQVSMSPTFATLGFDDSTITGTAQAVGPLANSTTFYWRVSGLNSSVAGPWSAVWSFVTGAAPAATTKPPVGVDAISANFQGIVNPNGTSTQAKFEFGTTTAYGNAITAVESPVAGTSPVNVSGVIRGLSPSTQYHYKLVAFNGAGTGEGGDVAFFTLTDQVALTSPPNGSVNQPSTLTLSWGSVAGADAYRLQLSTNSSFGTSAVDDSGVVSTSRSVGPLANNTTYYWHVSARNSAGWGSWSVPWSFTILPATPGIPTLISPASASVDQPTTLAVRWRALPAVSSYRLQVSLDSLFVGVVLDDSLVADTSRQISSLANQTKYFWRVRAKNAAGTGGWSSIWNFTTVPSLPGPPALIAPPNGASNVPTTLNLSWNASTGATSYRVQVSADQSFGSTTFDSSGITGTTATPHGLLTSTLYYWRVDAANAAGTTGWSSVWSFTTVPAPPPTPVLQSPPNNATGQPTSLPLSWSRSAGASVYRLQLSVSSVFGTTVIDDSTITDTSRQSGPLLNSTSYYWRVEARNPGGWSNWSPAWTFTTSPAPPGVPTLQAPANGATNQPAILTLIWNTVSGASGYWLQLATSAAFTVVIRNDSLLTATADQVGPLADSTTYFWRVRARNTGGLSDWSNTWQFTTARVAPPPPAVPALASPLNGAGNQPLSLALSWNTSSGAAFYHLQLSTSSSLNPLLLEDSSMTVTSRDVGPLSNSTAYYWRVRARNSGGVSGWTAPWAFTTTAPPPPPPDLSSPPNGATYQATSVTLQWTPASGASAYRLQVSRTTSFATSVLDDTSVAASSRQVGPLTSNTIYYWRVRARNAGAWGDWSQTWGFATGATPVPPTLSSPPDGATSQPVSPTLSWNSSVGATDYEVQVSTTASFNPIVEDDSLITGTSRVVGPLARNTTYYWRVRAGLAALTSDWSAVWSFSTATSSYPGTFSLSATVQYPAYSDISQFKPADYRLVGLPGAGNAAISSSLSGSSGTDWQAYWDNGAPSDYLVLYDGSATFRFTVGRAFWIIKNGPWNVSGTVPTAPLDSSGNARIPMHAGWNLITNPFTSSLAWTTVQSANSITDPIYSFNGSFAQSPRLDPYVGYYFFNSTNLAVLKVPYTSTSSSPPTAGAGNGEWRMNIILVSPDITDRAAWFGVSRQAMRGLDPLDFRKPAGISGAAGLSFQRPEWDPLYSSFATDVRPEISDVESWPFDVHAIDGQIQHLRFSGVRTVPPKLEVYLVDDERGAAQDLRHDSAYTFVQTRGTMKFEILVGKEEAMKLRLSSIRPRRFVLEDNYPNPFNPTTSLSIGIPAESFVSLGVFDMLGRQVRTLYNGTLKPGLYAFTWDGKDGTGGSLASGTYFSRLLTDRGVILTKKMILLR